MRKVYFTSLSAMFVLIGMTTARAGLIDLTTDGATGVANGSLWLELIESPTGTGLFKPFDRIQANGDEAGFNTDASNVLQNKDGIWTHTVQLSDLQIVTKGDAQYYTFVLDINETNSTEGRFLTLEEMRIYTATTGDISDEADLVNLQWDLDVGLDGNSSVLMDYTLGNGSGEADIQVWVPYFTSNDSYFYLYSKFSGADAGFEEWRAVTGENPPPVVPEPATLLLLGAGILGLGIARRKR